MLAVQGAVVVGLSPVKKSIGITIQVADANQGSSISESQVEVGAASADVSTVTSPSE